MARVFWDTNLFIYLFEKNDEWSPRVIDLRKRMRARQDELLTSWLTVGEALTKPRDAGNPLLEKSYLNFFSSGSVELVPFASEAAKRYADIRSQACAAAAGTDLFVTNDSRLSGLVISGITFITGIERVPY